MSVPNKGAGRTEDDSGAPKGVNYLLAIGIDKYQKLNRLYNCRLDVEALVKLLHDKYQFQPGHTTILMDGEATRTRIFKELDKLVDKVTPQDNLLLYFSGHGQYYKQLDEGYWIPVEGDPANGFNDYIPNGYIQKYLKSIKAHHSLIIADSCFSGAFFAERNIQTAPPDEKFSSRWVLTSGRTEPVSDGKPGEHSPFAQNILHFLEKNSSPALPLDRLIAYVKETTAANARQIPRGEPIADTGHKGGQFFFHLKRDEGRDWEKARKEHTIKGYTEFLQVYPAGIFRLQAEQNLEALEDERDWQNASQVHTIRAFQQYKRQHPQGKYQALADEKIRALVEERFEPVPAPRKSWSVNKRMLQGLLLVLLLFLAGYGIWRIWPKGTPEPTAINGQTEEVAEDSLSTQDTLPASQPPSKPEDKAAEKEKQQEASSTPPVVKPNPDTPATTKPKKSYIESEMKKVEGNDSIPTFYIGVHEVTNKEFCAFLNEEGNQEEGGNEWLKLGCGIEKKGDQFVPLSGKADHPVNCVSWYGAKAYCAWLSGKSGKKYRLPSDEEWEFAAKGGNQSKGYQYSGSNDINEVAWYSGNSNKGTKPVKQKKANELGIFDMSGNVLELCEYESVGKALSGVDRVIRGGSWSLGANDCRVSDLRACWGI
jgi:formylglycine-generating enzyme required for sulfatase activity